MSDDKTIRGRFIRPNLLPVLVRVESAIYAKISGSLIDSAIAGLNRWKREKEQSGRNWIIALFDADKTSLEQAVGMPVLGIGSERLVLSLSPNKVLKLPLDRSGMDANAEEARVWQRASPDLREHLVPVLRSDASGRWLIMAYAKPGPKPQPVPSELKRFYDLKSENWGVHDGVSKLLDYPF